MKRQETYDIIIIGAGAAGLAAAIKAADIAPKARIALLDKNERVGKKLITTGNGRCNLSNGGNLENRYHGDKDFAKAVFMNISVQKTLDFFNNIDIPTVKLEEDKIYPLCLQAGAVVDALRFAAEEKGVEFLLECPVISIKKQQKENIIEIYTSKGILYAKKILVCTGGKAAPKTGSDGAGYSLLTSLGHKLTKVFPAIVQITTQTEKTRPLKGIKTETVINILSGNKIKTEKGEILFTEYGISGPPVLQLSRFAGENRNAEINIDLLPDVNEEMLIQELKRRRNAHLERETKYFLTGILHSRLGQTVLKLAKISPDKNMFSDISDENIIEIIKNIKCFTLNSTGTLSWNNAQATAGGIDTAEFDSSTMESKKVKGIFAAGEILNVDGDCGGFNLQWAWSSGILAGQSMAKALQD